jgi:hypothetical protein
MPGNLEELKKQIEDGVHAAEELQRLLAERKREERPRFRLIKGGLLGGAIAAGVEWLRGYVAAIAIAATAVTVTGAVIAERPHSPGADPPQAITRPTVKPKPPVSPTPPSVTRAPRRTSPPRTQPTKAPVARPTPSLLPATPRLGATKTPQQAKTAVPTKTVVPIVTPTITSAPAEDCTGIGLLGLCLLGN